MIKRVFDLLLASLALVLCIPLLVLAAVGIRISSLGPIIYRTIRVGLNRRHFTMYKFRTMHDKCESFSSAITANKDSRIYPFGSFLRHFKLDELPQLVNILKGEMSIVGPRAEDPAILFKYYAPEHYETLCVLPGLTSPGSIYYYTCGEPLVDPKEPEKTYVERLLPIKLALDMIYVREASALYDCRIVLRTLWAMLLVGLGKRTFPDPPEMGRAQALIRPINYDKVVPHDPAN